MKDTYWKLFHETGEPMYYLLSKAHEEKAAAGREKTAEKPQASMTAEHPSGS